MMHSRSANNKINRLQERALRFVYNDYISSFGDLLNRDGSFTIHHHNIQSLAIEVYKSFHGLSCEPLEGIFQKNSNHYNLRYDTDVFRPYVGSVGFGEKSLRYFSSIVWRMIPSEIKEAFSLKKFKEKIRKWRPEDCPCRLCQEFIPGVGFVKIYE